MLLSGHTLICMSFFMSNMVSFFSDKIQATSLVASIELYKSF